MVPFIRGVYGDLRTTQNEFNANRVSANPTPPTSALQSKLGCANWCEKHLRRTLFFNYPKAMEYIRGGPLRDANWAADGDEYGGGECILFFCGPDEEAMLGVLRPLLQRSPLARGAHFVRLVESEDGEMRRENLRI